MDKKDHPPRPPPSQPNRYQVLLKANYEIKGPDLDIAKEKLAMATTEEEKIQAHKEIAQHRGTHSWWQEFDEKELNIKN